MPCGHPYRAPRPADHAPVVLPPASLKAMTAILSPETHSAASQAKAWPFEEARRLIKRLESIPGGQREDGPLRDRLRAVGPAAHRHLRRGRAHEHGAARLRGPDRGRRKTRLICFSDDMDGMRKIPDNVPDRAALEPYLQMPLTSVPNPFGGDYESFGDHNNAMLRRFLDTFGFDYEFASATEYYKSGRFDEVLLPRRRALRRHHGGDAADAGRRAAARPIAPSCRSRPRPAACSMCR